MPDLWVLLPVVVSAAVILLLYTIPPPWVKRYLKVFDAVDLEAITSPAHLGETIRHAYPPSDVAGVLNAIIEEQKPSIHQFIADEGVPMLAAIGSSDVASNARGGKSKLASAVGDLGGGAAGLQGIMGLIAKPGKASGMGDLMQYLPLLQQFTKSQSPDNGPAPPTPQQAGYSTGGNLGGS